MKKMAQFAFINPDVNLELCHEITGVKEPLWLSLGSQDDASQGYLLAYQSISLTLAQVRRVQTRNTLAN